MVSHDHYGKGDEIQAANDLVEKLLDALGTLAVTDLMIPLPMMRAEAVLDQAQDQHLQI